MAVVVLFAPSPARADGTADQAEFFETKVRPVLVDSCLSCHGSKKQSGALRLDAREALIEGGESGPAIVPGNPDASLLVQAIRKTHPDIKMPPKGRLAEPAVEAIAAWVKMGAPWPRTTPKTITGSQATSADHWAFRPVKAVPPPPVKDPTWVRTPVDAFILARLEKAGLEPSPAADKRTLLRRLSFDLTGLPPTPQEVENFLADDAPDAYERLVDRLLASPHYGERWGRHWLDIARYADTKGYVFQEERRYPYSYTYRDYVIRSLNEDKPYNAFLVEQIAADRLGPQNDPSSLAALGFLTLGRRFLNVQEDIIDDRIDVVCRGLLGLTVSCARCHDHKFDPVPTDDYYSLYGVFASSVEPAELPELPNSRETSQTSDFRKQLKVKQQVVDDFLKTRRTEIQNDLRARSGLYFRAAFDLGFDPRNPKLDERAKADNLSTNRLRGVINRLKTKLDEVKGQKTPDPVFGPWLAFASLPEAEFSKRAPGITQELAKSEGDASNPVVVKAIADHPPSRMADAASLYAQLFNQAETHWREALKAKPDLKQEESAEWEPIRQVLYAEDGPFTVRDDILPRMLDRKDRNEYNRLVAEVAALRATHPGSPPRAMVLNDKPVPVNPRVFIRGNSGRPGKEVPRQFLGLIAGPDRKPFQDGGGRLDLARAIASDDNPLTARVLVNRLWLQHFGVGLVTTPSDFGLRSDPPSHPELLDWLAAELVRNGWSLKRLHRTIVLSNTYQQVSDNRSDGLAKDPENRLLWKFHRRRLDFEAMRDAVLASTDALDPTMGGRATPIFEAPFPPRRTIYGFIDRQNLEGTYRTFDFASPDTTSPKRHVTTVPQQALFLMNSPFILDQARRLADVSGAGAPEPRERIHRLYARLFGRGPRPEEVALGLEFVAQQESAGSAAPPTVPTWQYGSGRLEEKSGRVEFQPLPHWTGSAWQRSPVLPDPSGSFLHWNAGGGHPDVSGDKLLVLRWTAPRDGAFTASGTLGHEAPQGDGVSARVISSKVGVLGTWVAHHGKTATPVKRIELRKGDVIDFVVDCRTTHDFDVFTWAPVVREVGARVKWDARAEFHGPPPPALSAWEEYAQVLLLTNEFVFVD
jgi:hypothetical protein